MENKLLLYFLPDMSDQRSNQGYGGHQGQPDRGYGGQRSKGHGQAQGYSSQSAGQSQGQAQQGQSQQCQAQQGSQGKLICVCLTSCLKLY